jgi:hypothetical protein
MIQPDNYDFQSAVLYYLNTCPYSKRFIQLLREYPMLQSKIQLIALDGQRGPPYVREVPFILVNGNQQYPGTLSFKWLEKQAKRSFQDNGSFGSTQLGAGKIGSGDLDFSFIGNEGNNSTDISNGQQSAIGPGLGVMPPGYQPPPQQPPQFQQQLPANSPAVLFQQQSQYPVQEQKSGQYVLPPFLRSQQVSSADDKINMNNMSQHLQKMQQERMNLPQIPRPQMFQAPPQPGGGYR